MGDAARALAQSTGLALTVADWLNRRGHEAGEQLNGFLQPKLTDLTQPDQMADRDAAAERIARAIKDRERIAVFGDYDCDGITSASIMTEVLRALGGDAVPFLASRFEGGYGVSAPAVDKILKSEPGVLVTCDCGSSDHASLQRTQDAGVDNVVIDHHLVPAQPLPAVAFLNPHRDICDFPYKGMASCGLALSMAAALRSKLDQKLDIRSWLDLVAIGTIADVAPLDGDNRVLVRAGLKRLSQAERPGIRALFELAKITPGEELGGRDVAFRIAPRLNAPGRLGSPDIVLELLTAKDITQARGIAAEIEQLTIRRRRIQDEMIEAAYEDIASGQLSERAGSVIGREGWNSGIVGIVAGRLADKYKVPVAVIGFEDGHGRGSVRGPDGVRLHDMLSSIEGVMDRFGGHQAAAGLEVNWEKFSELAEAFDAAAKEFPPTVPAGSRFDDVVWLDPGDDPASVIRDLYRVEPCGEKNPRPRIAVRARVTQARSVKGGHLKLSLAVGDARLSGFAPTRGDLAKELGGSALIIGDLKFDTYRGNGAVEIYVDEIFPLPAD